MADVLIVGCGDLGSGLAEHLLAAGHRVVGVKRSPPLMSVAGVDYRQVDITEPQAVASLPTDFDQVFVILTPGGRNAAAYRAIYLSGVKHLLDHFARAGSRPHWLLVSSTSVYGQDRGEWVDEDSPTEPRADTAQVLRAAEVQVLAHQRGNTVVRFSGIYGPGRERLLRAVAAGEPVQYAPPTYTNRIHRDDCIGVLQFLLERRFAGIALDDLYLASDCEPASAEAVATWIAAQLGCAAPPARLAGAVVASANKRCVSARLQQLGYCFRFPTFREGYLALIQAFRARGDAR
ncbi:MAG: SDR family oxidoreductase [Porticoccaceae bacterium]